MSLELFSKKWGKTLCTLINQDDSYREMASDWEWPLILKYSDTHGIRLNLQNGTCKGTAVLEETDETDTPIIVSAPVEHWKQLYEGELQPISALVQGKLKLEKGSLMQLIKHTKSATRLLKITTRIDTKFAGSGTATPSDTNSLKKSSMHENGQPRGTSLLDMDSFPMQLFQKAKKLGVWDPAEIDFSKDHEHWSGLEEREKEVILHLTSLFLAGEESVTEDLLPLLLAMSKEHRIEEEIYLTSFLWEEAKHTEFFNRFLNEVIREPVELERFHSNAYKEIFYKQLPDSMDALLKDSGPDNQLRASVTYNMIVEGVLAETGYHAYYEMLEEHNLMPGLQEGLKHLKRDESRHIAYGVYLISRLLQEHPELHRLFQQRMNDLLEHAIEAIDEIFERYEIMPFGLEREAFIEFASSQFRKRLDRIEQARNQSLEDLSPTID